ncbi:MAG: competence protein ComEA [Microgenomates group bacterium Gr01-1014_7]|nr:MAG: competence protein ComEA [Microgenomates group bacterium Gr01-1014_7]
MLKERLEKFKIPIALSLLGIVLIIGGTFASGLNKHPTTSSGQGFPKESLVNSQKMISVDVSGAVNRPGVYKLNEGSIVEDAIRVGGGFSDSANKEYISKYLNMAQKLSDGSKVYVPLTGETGPGVHTGSSVSATNPQSKVNINTSTQAELEALPGIGPVTASKIISGRPYQTSDELVSKKVVSKIIFEKIKDSLVVY